MPLTHAKLFSSFVFYHLQDSFRKLPQNAQMTQKAEFEDILDRQQERSFIRTYMTAGLDATADILLWRMDSSILKMQEMSASLAKTGFGKWLTPVHSYIGLLKFTVSDENINMVKEANERFGHLPYMMIHPLEKNTAWHNLPDEEKKAMMNERNKVLSKHSNLRETFFSSYGLDSQDYVVQREASSATELEEATSELRLLKNKEYTLSDTPVYFCVGRSLPEILDFLA